MEESNKRKVAKSTKEGTKGNEKKSLLVDGMPNIPLWQLTVPEFAGLMIGLLSEFVAHPTEKSSRDPPLMVHGLDGLCELIGCSKSTAMRLKNSGVLDEAIVQIGRKIIINADKALEILK